MAFNQLKAGALLSYVSLILGTTISLMYTPFMLRMLGQSEYGLYSLVASIVGYLTILDFGFGNAVIRFTSQIRSQGKLLEQYEMFGMFLTLYVTIGVLAFIVGLGFYFNVDLFFGSSMTADELGKARIMMLLLISNLAITFPLSIFGSIIIAYENFVFQKLVNIIRTLLNPLIMIPLLLVGYKAVMMVVIITILNIASLLINMWYCFIKLKIRILFKRFDFRLLKEISGYSFFVFLGIIVDRIYWNTGQFVLGIVAGTSAIAIYSIAVQLQMYYLNFSMAISSVLLPKVTSMVTNNSSEKELSDLFIRTGRLQYLIMAYIVCGFVLFGKAFVQIWAGPDYSESYLIAVIIMIPLTFPSIQNLGIIILQARNQLKFRSVLYIFIAFCSLLLSIPMALLYGGLGCAISTSLALIIGNIVVMNIYYFRHIHIDIPLFWKEILKMSWPLIIMIVIGILLNTIHPNDNILSLGMKISLFTLFYIPITWFITMNTWEQDLLKVPIIKIVSKIKSLIPKR